jgi:hypothetical protein
LASTARDTVRLFSPISMNTVPSTTSRPFSVAAPVRSSRPMSDFRDVADPYRHAMDIAQDDIAQILQTCAADRARGSDTVHRASRCNPHQRWLLLRSMAATTMSCKVSP